MNKNITRCKREEVKKLKERRECLRSQLSTFTEYGSDPSQRSPLVSILKSALEFAKSGSENVTLSAEESRDMDMGSPTTSAMQARVNMFKREIGRHVI